MRSTTRYVALGLAGLLLAACGHKDKNAPLAFVPADTPYVVANLDTLDDETRQALLAQADQQLPGQLAQLKSSADEMANRDPDTARLLHAIIQELDGKSIASFAQGAGLDVKGRTAFYGIGLSPVLRFELTDEKAFDAFVERLQKAYGKPLDTEKVGDQSYRRHIATESGVQLVLAVVGKQAVAAILPADAQPALLRQALGLDRPDHNLQDDGRLADLAKDKGYQPWAVGLLDLNRLLPLIGGGKDPLFIDLLKARAQAESAKTGEPVANQLQVPDSCLVDAKRVAAQIPAASFGYTKLDAKHQDLRWNVALASDVSKAFSGLKVELPGLGGDSSAPFELNLALPVAQLRDFWTVQTDAVTKQPFACPALSSVNDAFAKLGPVLQKASISPFGELRGLRIALDSFDAGQGALPKLTGRVVIGSSNPNGLLGMAQIAMSSLNQLKLDKDGTPKALPPELTQLVQQPGWAAMSEQALGVAIGAGEDGKLASDLKLPTGDAGEMGRLHLNGDMYRHWIDLMEARADAVAAANQTLANGPQDPAAAASAPSPVEAQANAARVHAQFESMKTQAARIESVKAELKVDDSGLVIDSQTELK